MRYENGTILAEGNLLMLHGRFTGLGLPANWIVVDIVRLENGLLAAAPNAFAASLMRWNHSRQQRPMSAFLPKADIAKPNWHVRLAN
jgi:hypothetical protein